MESNNNTMEARRMWKRIGKACGWRHLRAPSVRLLWKEKAKGAVLDFLGGTRVGCRAAVMATIGPREEGGDLRGGGAGGGRRPGRARPRLFFFSLSFPFPFPFFSFVTGGEGLGDKGAPLGPATVGDRIWSRFLEKPAVAAMALRAARSGISKIPYTGVAAAN